MHFRSRDADERDQREEEKNLSKIYSLKEKWVVDVGSERGGIAAGTGRGEGSKGKETTRKIKEETKKENRKRANEKEKKIRQ